MPSALGQMPFPTQLAFEPIQLCNATCFCCPYTWLNKEGDYRGKKMTAEQIMTLLDDFGSVRKKYGYTGELVVHPFRFSDPTLTEHLELILKKCDQYKMSVVLTTNGVYLTDEKLAIIDKYRHRLIKLTISLIGSNKEDVSQFMKINFDKVIDNINKIAKEWPYIRSITQVMLRVVKDTPEERNNLENLVVKFREKGITVKGIIEDWMRNRVDMSNFSLDGKPEKAENKKQTEDRFICGCGWREHLLERLEVAVDGDVILCCDDAEKHKVFGNVFKDGIKKVWNEVVRKEHELIMEQNYTPQKNSLICSSCITAKWHDTSKNVEFACYLDDGIETNEAFLQRKKKLELSFIIQRQNVMLRKEGC